MFDKINFNFFPKPKVRFGWKNYIMFCGATMVLTSLILGSFFSTKSFMIIGNKIAEAEERSRPAEISVVVVAAEDCDRCASLDPVLDVIRKQNVRLTESRILSSSAKGKDIIEKHGVEKLPSFTLEGELDKESAVQEILFKTGRIDGETFVFTAQSAPYMEVASGKMRGGVNITLLGDGTCNGCYDTKTNSQILRNFGLLDPDMKDFDARSVEGRSIINRYSVRYVPTVLISGDVEAYPSLVNIWPKVGSIEKDGTYILREGVNQVGTYKDLWTGKITTPKTDNDAQSNEK